MRTFSLLDLAVSSSQSLGMLGCNSSFFGSQMLASDLLGFTGLTGFSDLARHFCKHHNTRHIILDAVLAWLTEEATSRCCFS